MLLDDGAAMSSCPSLHGYNWQAERASPHEGLRTHLTQHYDELLGSLTRRLGCRERAHDALHDTWLKLHQERAIGHVASPAAYILRMAQNRAIDQLRSDAQRGIVQWSEDAALHDHPDFAPGPETIAADRSLLSLLVRVIECLPRQRRAIFLAARVEELSTQEVACRYGVTTTKVRTELRKAHAYCERELLYACAPGS